MVYLHENLVTVACVCAENYAYPIYQASSIE